MMRLFIFKLLFRLTWWVAPNRRRVNKIFEIYEEYIKAEEDYIKCQERQAQMDSASNSGKPTNTLLVKNKEPRL